jgi:hypothetical protein
MQLPGAALSTGSSASWWLGGFWRTWAGRMWAATMLDVRSEVRSESVVGPGSWVVGSELIRAARSWQLAGVGSKA